MRKKIYKGSKKQIYFFVCVWTIIWKFGEKENNLLTDPTTIELIKENKREENKNTQEKQERITPRLTSRFTNLFRMVRNLRARVV